MKNFLFALGIALTTSLAAAPSAVAFEGGGRQPSAAPLIAVSQHYTGQLSNRRDDANFDGNTQVAIWRLPPLSARDVLYVNWHSVPKTSSPGSYPVCMTFAQAIDDYTWGSRFEDTVGTECEGSAVYTLSGSGTARTAITVQESNSDSSYLEFFTSASESTPSEFEAFPYDFSIEAPLHYLGVAIRDTRRVAANGIVQATALLANGLPAPDGVPFALTVTWDGGGSASYTGTSSGGVVSFQLALPETAYDERGTFVVTHPADGTYIKASSRLRLNIKEPGPTPCTRAQRWELTLRHKYKRLSHRARRAHTTSQRVALHKKAAKVKRRLRTAHRRTEDLCGP
jgi:hypothetical protein